MTVFEFLILFMPCLIGSAVFLLVMRHVRNIVKDPTWRISKNFDGLISDDTEALKRDWQRVGDDLRAALNGAESDCENAPMKEGER